MSIEHATHLNQKKQTWAQNMLSQIGLSVHLKSPLPCIPKTQSHIFVGNHVSYLDILVLMSLIPEIVFVSKSEVSKWPIIGAAALRVGTLFIERENKNHRALIREKITKQLKNQPTYLAIFPSGTTQIQKKNRWRWGIFEIAHQTQTPVIAFKLKYYPERLCAFIDDDSLLPHILSLTRHNNLSVNIEFLEPQFIKQVEMNCIQLESWAES